MKSKIHELSNSKRIMSKKFISIMAILTLILGVVVVTSCKGGHGDKCEMCCKKECCENCDGKACCEGKACKEKCEKMCAEGKCCNKEKCCTKEKCDKDCCEKCKSGECCGGEKCSVKKDCCKKGDEEKTAAAYACPMHPEITSDKPGKCSECGMDLEKN